MGAKSLSRNCEIRVAGAWIEAMIGRSGVFGYDETDNAANSLCRRYQTYLVYFGYEM